MENNLKVKEKFPLIKLDFQAKKNELAYWKFPNFYGACTRILCKTYFPCLFAMTEHTLKSLHFLSRVE